MTRCPINFTRFVLAALAIGFFGIVPTAAFQATKSSSPKSTKPKEVTSNKTSTAVRSLDEVLEPIRKKHQLPALAAAVMQADRIVAIGAVGLRQVGATEPVTTDDKFHLGSISKPM